MKNRFLMKRESRPRRHTIFEKGTKGACKTIMARICTYHDDSSFVSELVTLWKVPKSKVMTQQHLGKIKNSAWLILPWSFCWLKNAVQSASLFLENYIVLGQWISLSFLDRNGWNLVSRHIFSRCLDIQNFSFLSLVLSKLWNF